MTGVAGRILDGAADESGRVGSQANCFSGRLRTVTIAIFEVGGHGKRRGFDDGARVSEGFLASDGSSAVATTKGEGEAGTGGGKGSKSEAGEETGGAGIPGIGNDENFRPLMERQELSSFFSLVGHGITFDVLSIQRYLTADDRRAAR